MSQNSHTSQRSHPFDGINMPAHRIEAARMRMARCETLIDTVLGIFIKPARMATKDQAQPAQAESKVMATSQAA